VIVSKRSLLCLLVLVPACIVVSVAPALASFGFQTHSFENRILNEDGSPDVQAGSHAFTLITGFKFNTRAGLDGVPIPDGDAKDIEVELPPGLVGNANGIPQCMIEQFNTRSRLPLEDRGGTIEPTYLSGASCPESTQVGFAQVELSSGSLTFGVYNLVPPPGVPAEFGFNPIGIPVVLTPSVRTGDGYGVTVSSKNTNQAQRLYGTTVSLWGVPADPSHNGLRGECLGLLGESLIGSVGASACQVETARKPFLRLPTSCSSEPLAATVHANSWQNPLELVSEVAFDQDSEGHPVGIVGCGRLDFSPTVSVQPDTGASGSPTGLRVEVGVPQNENPDGLGEADLKDTVVTLPAGMSVSPSGANELQTCTENEIALGSAAPVRCPEASKVGTVEIATPLLETPLVGSVYVATPYENPSKGLLELYVVAEGPGVLVKLPGEAHADPSTGQLTTTFDDAPQQPFSHLKLTLFGGPRAALMTPQTCGTYRTTGSLTPWSSTIPTVFAPQEFMIDTSCGGGFSPSLVAGTVSNQAGGFSPFTFTLSRSDQDQDFGRLSVRTPPGLLGMLSKVPLCGEPQAALGTCPAASQIGHVTVGAGPGPDSIFVPQGGKPQDAVYLTGPYNGAPFGLSIVVPPEAGPFNLGPPVVVRSAIDVDPHTAQITIDSAQFPRILQGIPLDVKTINVTIDRENFIFNPTNCQPLTLDATVVSTQNATASLSSPFRASDCGSLGFSPKFTASTQGKTSKADGASLDVKLGYPKGTEANIASVKASLPKQLPSRLTTIQKACTKATFDANPATCPAASNIGTAIADTPVLNAPLIGPAYLVSHGGAAFPDVVIILQGQGIVFDLVGGIDIVKGITTSTFASVPDAPISSFELKLPEGPHSALTGNLPEKAKHSFCKTPLTIPTVIDAQNGARIAQNTKIAVTGCPKAKQAKARSGRG
jgi:hypothetical protein